MNPATEHIQAMAAEALDALDRRRSIDPFSRRERALDLDTAYAVAADVRRLRVARGERPVGRKIGFTNRGIWSQYTVYSPIWGDMYDCTVRNVDAVGTFEQPVGHMLEPRIEPEIVFGMARTPEPDMDDVALLHCIEWVAHGFEFVQSIYPGWSFQAVDTVIGFGMHGALAVGPKRPVTEAGAATFVHGLPTFEIALSRGSEEVDRGQGRNVLDGPLSALRHLIRLLRADRHNPPLSAGEIVSTGSLTGAFPVSPGENWSTAVSGLPLPGLSVRIVAG